MLTGEATTVELPVFVEPLPAPPSRWALLARWIRNRWSALWRRETATETTGVYDAFDY